MVLRETTELLERINAEEYFSSLVQICLATTPSLSSKSSFDLIDLNLALICATGFKALLRQVCSLSIRSNPFEWKQMESDEDVEPPESWTRTRTAPEWPPQVWQQRLWIHVHVIYIFYFLLGYPMSLEDANILYLTHFAPRAKPHGLKLILLPPLCSKALMHFVQSTADSSWTPKQVS